MNMVVGANRSMNRGIMISLSVGQMNTDRSNMFDMMVIFMIPRKIQNF